jgi:hypothetical protein
MPFDQPSGVQPPDPATAERALAGQAPRLADARSAEALRRAVQTARQKNCSAKPNLR